MIEILKYILLGLIQGIAEVLPISSSAHLIIAQDIMNISDDSLTFEVILHLASLIAILFFLGKKLWRLIRGFCLFVFKKEKEYQKEFKYCLMLVVSTIPTVIFTLIFKDVITEFGSTLWIVGLLLMINGIMLMFLTRIKGTRQENDLNYKDALVIGCFQCFGVFSGISRSGSCLSGAFSRKIDKEVAADYAFLMFVPAVLGATVLEFTNFKEMVFVNSTIIPYAISFVIAGVTTYFSFKVLLTVIRKGKLSWFGYYCLAIGLSVLIYGLV
ncbi:MAG: undecaprenyl-diphosphate phosphatase [Bacilli bacterium]|nr:undecaprenyl-diphosphate phosphatase [Bacilli bacterium]